MASGLPFRFKLYLEGVKVPFSSGTVVARREGPCVANLRLAPSVPLSRALPRTLAHVFYYDSMDKDWHLLFEGEVSGKGRVKQEGSRDISIVAQGISNHWYRSYVYMLNETLGFHFGNVIKMRGLSTDKAYLAANRLIDISRMLEGDIEGSFKKILSRIPEVNDFYQDAENRLKITSRIKTLSDPQVVELFRMKHYFEQVYDSLIRSHVSEVAPVINLVKGLASLIYYDWTEIPNPRAMDTQVVFKPETYFCPVPKCNVFFPGRHQSVTEDRDFLSEPTRLILVTNLGRQETAPGEIDTSSLVRIAPAELQKVIDGIAATPGVSGGEATAALLEQIKDLSTSVLTAEEKIKGIIPQYASLAPSEWLLAQRAPGDPKEDFDQLANEQVRQSLKDWKEFRDREITDSTKGIWAELDKAEGDIAKGTREGRQNALSVFATVRADLERELGKEFVKRLPPLPEIDEDKKEVARAVFPPDPGVWLTNIVNWRFSLLRTQYRSVEIGHSFNPWVVAGFPGGLLDTFGHLIGMVESVTHSFTVEGGATAISLTHVLNPSDETIPGMEVFPTLPPWFSTKYATGDAYTELLGSSPVSSDAKGSVAALERLFKDMKTSRNRLKDAMTINRRPVIIEKEFYAFLGASGNGGGSGESTVYSGGPFRAPNQAPIKEHVDFLAKKKGVLAP